MNATRFLQAAEEKYQAVKKEKLPIEDLANQRMRLAALEVLIAVLTPIAQEEHDQPTEDDPR